jgi:hypothetical protein
MKTLKDYREIFFRAHEIFKMDVDDSGRKKAKAKNTKIRI